MIRRVVAQTKDIFVVKKVICPVVASLSRCIRPGLLIVILVFSVAMALKNSPQAHAASISTDLVTVKSEAVVTGLDHPWGLDFLPDGSTLVTERAGRLFLLEPDGTLRKVAGLPKIAVGGQGGLLDVAVSPDFETDAMIYFSFSQSGKRGAGTAVARARFVSADGKPGLERVETIFSMERKTNAGQHFGSRLVFHPDGTLFVTTGDRGDRDRAQDFFDHAGAVIRINPGGSVPADNPFSDGKSALPEIWSKGHRNPQGAIYDPVTKSLWTVEHGARGGDELNRPQAGKNYGWPVISYGRHYSGFKIGAGTEAPGYEQPIWYWDPSIAPSGLAVYDGDMFPEWYGDFLVGALKFRLLVRLDREGQDKIIGEERMFERQFGRIRDVNIAPDGSIWLLTDEKDGAIIRLSRAK